MSNLTIYAECTWCGMWHAGVCPLVKVIEYYADGSIKRIEFHERTRDVHEGAG